MRFLTYLLIGLFCFVGMACNAFENFDRPGTSNDLGELLIDADIALQKNDTNQAVSILRHARGLYPEEKRINVRLSTALLQHHNIGAPQALRMARSLTNSGESSIDEGFASNMIAATTEEGLPPVCSFPEDHDYEQFELEEIESFADFNPEDEVLDEIQVLISEVLGTENETIDEFDPSDEESIQETIDRLQDEDGEDALSDEEIASIMVNDAVATLTQTYLELSKEARDEYQFYYVTSPVDEEYLGYCAESEKTFDEAEHVAGDRSCEVKWVRDLLIERVDLLGDSNSTEDELSDPTIAEAIAGYADEAYEVFARELGDLSCNADE